MRNKQIIFQLFLSIVILTGILALVFFWGPPSWGDQGVFVAYSASRIALGLMVVLVLALCALGLWTSRWKQLMFDEMVSSLHTWGSQGTRWVVILIILVVLTVYGITGLASFQAPFFQDYSTYAPLFEFTLAQFETGTAILAIAWPLVVWGVALLFLTMVLWLAIFPELVSHPQTYRPAVILRTLLALVIITISLLHAGILAMQMNVLTAIPGWYWDIQAKPFSPRDAAFLLLLIASLALIGYVLTHPGNTKLHLIALFFLGWFIQVGFGVIDGDGFESLRLKYAASLHQSHARKASADDIDILQTVREYETLYGGSMFQSTKPPGTILIYMGTRYLSDWITPQPTVEARFQALTRFEAYVFPFISLLVLFVLYGISRTFLPVEDRLLPSILYILLPNVMLLPLFLDQVLYPLLFILGAYLMIKVVDHHSFPLALLGGAILYLFAFFTFSMLPLIPFAFLYIVIRYWMNRADRNLRGSLGLYFGILLGFLLMFVLFDFALGYNALSRYQGAMSVVRNFDFLLRVDVPQGEQLPNTGFLLPIRHILSAFTLNNMEFAAAIGYPIYVLFLVQGVITLLAFVRNKTDQGQALLVSFFATFFAMNVFAPIQGEAARLWIFWAPVMVIFAGTGISSLFKGNRRFVYLLVVLQLTTMYLTFKFQDFVP